MVEEEVLEEGRDVAATSDVRAPYASVGGYGVGRDHQSMCRNAFYGADLPDLTKAIFG